MKIFLLLCALCSAGNLFAQVAPRIDIVSIKPAPIDHRKEVRVVLKIVNHTDRSLYYTGYGRLGIVVHTESRQEQGWASDIIMQSGIGFEQFELAPGSDLEVTVTPQPPPFRKIGEPEPTTLTVPVRFRFDCRSSPRSPEEVHAYSRECEPNEFIRK